MGPEEAFAQPATRPTTHHQRAITRLCAGHSPGASNEETKSDRAHWTNHFRRPTIFAVRPLLARILVICTVTSLSSAARAEGGYVSAGPLGARVYGTGVEGAAWAYGGELSFSHYRRSCCWEDGWGLFAHYLRYTGDKGSHRIAMGYQIPGPLGIELGAAVRFGDAGWSPSFHVAPFASIGLMHVALRLSPGMAPYGSEIALVLAFKLPVPFGDPPPSLRMPSGRPLEVNQQARLAPIRRSCGWA